MSYLYEKNVTCPVCDAEFATSKVKQAGVKLEKRDSDFCGYYTNDNPTFYGVFVCPECGLSAFESDFEDLDDPMKASVKNRISPKWNKKSFGGERSIEDAIMVHQLCLLNYDVMNRKKSDVAKVCLRLAWFYRALGNKEREDHFIKFAHTNYMKAFDSEILEEDPENQMLVYYLLGELNRRMGQYKDALYWFQETLKLDHIKSRKQIEELTRDQIQEAKEQLKKEQDKQKK